MPLQPLILYSVPRGANPWKVAIILEELSLPYKTIFEDFAQLKSPPFTTKNPNGRVPVIEDPNTSITLWESGAIIEYLISTYDTDNKISYPPSMRRENALLAQWLFFQVSGQGAYFGQCAWFQHFHAEKNLDSVIERYAGEVKRVVGVLDAHLASRGLSGYLVGDKATYADLAFVAYDTLIPFLLDDEEAARKLFEEYPCFADWHHRLMARPAVRKIEDDKAKAANGVIADG